MANSAYNYLWQLPWRVETGLRMAAAWMVNNTHFMLPYAEEYCRERGWSNPKFIKAGKTAEVFKVEGASGFAALKIFNPTMFLGDIAPVQVSRLELQRDSLVGLKHPNIISMYETCPIPKYQTWAILMEYLPWRDLEDATTDFPPASIWLVAEQLASATKFLEKHGLVHRDIKPSNIIISADFATAKLLDFGVLRRSDTFDGSGTPFEGEYRFVATRRYSSPTYLFGPAAPEIDTVPDDFGTGWRALTFYQIGGVLHDLIMRRPLFADCEQRYGLDARAALQQAVLTETPILENPQVDRRLIDLTRDCLTKEDAARLAQVTWERFSESTPVVPPWFSSARALLADINQDASKIAAKLVLDTVIDLARDILAQAPNGAVRVRVSPIARVDDAVLTSTAAHKWPDVPEAVATITHIFSVQAGPEQVFIRYGAALSLNSKPNVDALSLQVVTVLDQTELGGDTATDLKRILEDTLQIATAALQDSKNSLERLQTIDIRSS